MGRATKTKIKWLPVLVFLCAWPSTAQGQRGRSSATTPERATAPRAGGGLHLGFGGEREIQAFGRSGRADLAPAVGAHLRLSWPVGDYFAIGPLLLVGAPQRTNGADRDLYIDFDVLPRGRLPFSLEGDTHGEVYAGLPVGFTTVATVGELGDAFGTGPGYNLGLVFGGQLFFGSVGVLAELGWLRHWTTHEVEDVDETADVTSNQGVVNLGVAFLLG